MNIVSADDTKLHQVNDYEVNVPGTAAPYATNENPTAEPEGSVKLSPNVVLENTLNQVLAGAAAFAPKVESSSGYQPLQSVLEKPDQVSQKDTQAAPPGLLREDLDSFIVGYVTLHAAATDEPLFELKDLPDNTHEQVWACLDLNLSPSDPVVKTILEAAQRALKPVHPAA